MPRRDHEYFVYIVASRSHTLYCGVTNSIRRRMLEHREGKAGGFTATFHCNRLVWFERFEQIDNAIDREKQIKRWRREKKVTLIQMTNPTWRDLSQAWEVVTADPSISLRFSRDDKP